MMEIVVHQGESEDGTTLAADDTDVIDVKNPAQATNKLVSTLNEYGRRLRELEKPSGSQLTQAIQKVLDISANIDQTVAASINRNSYDRASQPSRKVKQDFLKPDITLEQMRAVDWTLYRFIDDVNLNGDSATIHLGMIAEELDDNGLGQFVEYNDDYEPCGINYPMLGVWAIHEAHLAHDRIDRLEERLKALEGKIDNDVEE